MTDHKNAENFSYLMLTCGNQKKITTPSYAEFIEELSVTFDLNNDELGGIRSREMTESNSLSNRQLIYERVLQELFSLLDINGDDQGFIRRCLLKVENILTHFKSITICSNQSSKQGSAAFFTYIAFPQILEMLRFFNTVRGIEFSLEMRRYLGFIVYQGKNTSDCIKMLKREIAGLITNQDCTEFRSWIDKIDSRSFPKTKTIKKRLQNLHTELTKGIRSSSNTDNLVLQVKFKLLAAKAAFNILKTISSNPHKLSFLLPFHSVVTSAHHNFCTDYICNEEVSEMDYGFTTNDFFQALINHYLQSIESMDPEDIPAEIARSPIALAQYENNAFLPWFVYHQLLWDLGKGRVNALYIRKIENAFLLTIRNYQYGQLADKIVTILLAMKIKTSTSIPHNSLEPLAMALMENNAIANQISQKWETPFGYDEPKGPEEQSGSYTSDFNVTKAIRIFNKSVELGEIDQTPCNPLEGLDQMLKYIFNQIEKGVFFNKELSFPSSLKRPVKTLDLDRYDALKNINRLLDQFGLIESIKDVYDAISVNTSLAGNFINKYLALAPSEKMAILKVINQVKYEIDQK